MLSLSIAIKKKKKKKKKTKPKTKTKNKNNIVALNQKNYFTTCITQILVFMFYVT